MRAGNEPVKKYLNMFKKPAPCYVEAPWIAVAAATAFAAHNGMVQQGNRCVAGRSRSAFAVSHLRTGVLTGAEGGSCRYRTPRRAAPAPGHLTMDVSTPDERMA